jgi:aryl-alcohol dehydrogenase-like predicted oxidoreductase
MKRSLVSVSNAEKHIKASKNTPRTYAFGRSGLMVSPVGAGTLQSGINWFDTAELYGRGRSEELLGRFANGGGVGSDSDSSKPLIATKFFPYPWRVHKSSFRRALRASLRRLNADSIDLYQTHFPYRPRSFTYWVDALADAVQDGLIRAAGV